MFDAHYPFIWRQLRRLGVPDEGVDDAAQELFMIAARRMGDIRVGAERAFLFGVARRVAADARRSRAVRPVAAGGVPDEQADAGPNPEQALGNQRARKILGQVLDEMQDDTREAFVLFELEQLSKSEVAAVLGVPEGTAASRLRRARDEFMAIAQRTKARLGIPLGTAS
jgi:RNA polymerase sigma-70 factor (ECF subfamily)